MLLERLPSSSPQRTNVEQIEKAAERAASLTRQLLAFSRKQVLHSRVLDLNEVVAGMIQMVSRVIGENIGPGPYVMLTVTDTGCGMDAQTQSRIFEPFFTTKDPGKGTGLGLATVYGIIKQSGGYIWVYSETSHGTTFKVYLPKVAAETEKRNVEKALPGPAPGSETILFVEDEEGVRELVRDYLATSGYRVLDAADGVQALEIATAHRGPIQLLITDVVMPRVSGRELATRLSSARPDLRVLFISGYTDDSIFRHGVLEGGVAFLQKPFTLKAIGQKIREVLDGELATTVLRGNSGSDQKNSR
jgi:two-component system cell cycle sensor histidine kinase/response regulator CckA